MPALSSPGQALRVFIVAVRCVYLRRTSVLSLVPIVALLFSDSTSLLLCHVACTIRKNVCVKFWVGTTAMLTTDVYLTVTLLFYVRMVRSAATNTWLPHPCAGCIFVRTSAASIDSGNNRRTSALPLVPFASLLFSGSTLPLLSHVACTVRQDLYVQFCAGTAVLAADVYLVVPLLFYVLV